MTGSKESVLGGRRIEEDSEITEKTKEQRSWGRRDGFQSQVLWVLTLTQTLTAAVCSSVRGMWKT